MKVSIPNVLETFTTLDLGDNGYERVLNVVTDLPIEVQQPGFDAEKLDDLCRAVGKLIGPGEYDRALVSYRAKSN